MSEEIKEILDNFEKYEARYRLRNETQFIITHREIQILLDYITNLQEEYEKEHYLVDKLTRQLNDEYKNTEYQCKQKEDYKSRNEKAIEYLEHEQFKRILLGFGRDKYLENIKNEAINILQGSDKE